MAKVRLDLRMKAHGQLSCRKEDLGLPQVFVVKFSGKHDLQGALNLSDLAERVQKFTVLLPGSGTQQITAILVESEAAARSVANRINRYTKKKFGSVFFRIYPGGIGKGEFTR